MFAAHYPDSIELIQCTNIVRHKMHAWHKVLLPRRSLLAWGVAFLAPPAFFTLLEIGDLVGLKLGAGTGWLVYFVPLLSLLACWTIVVISSARSGAKAGWLFFSLLALFLEFIALVIFFGCLGFARHGMEGIQ